MVKIIINPDLIKAPFTFNPMKHHLGFIRGFIKKAELFADEPEIFELINSIGSKVTDIYCGLLSVNQIIDIIYSQLSAQSVYNKSAYEVWVNNSGRNFNFLELADGSKWTFRQGEKIDRYIHFHPARTNGSLRMRGTTLRTAIALKIIAGDNLLLYQDKDFINFVRQKRLYLSPIKSLSAFPAINKVLGLLNENCVIGLRT